MHVLYVWLSETSDRSCCLVPSSEHLDKEESSLRPCNPSIIRATDGGAAYVVCCAAAAGFVVLLLLGVHRNCGILLKLAGWSLGKKTGTSCFGLVGLVFVC